MRLLAGLVSTALVTLPVLALAAAGPAPMPEPDPSTRNMSRYQIQLRTFDACLVIQSRLQQTTREAVHSACSCYAKGTVAAMTREEISFFQQNSVFNDSTRDKALDFIDRCKLQRPI